MAKFKITLRDTKTGFERTFERDYEITSDLVRWNWDEGNYSCDCNRSVDLWQDESKELGCNLGENQIELVELEEVSS